MNNWFNAYIIVPIVTGIISGFVANKLYTWNATKRRENLVKKNLSRFTGKYDVYHLSKDLLKPDACNYKITITHEEKAGILIINQSGEHDHDELVAQVKIDELTFNYGEGIYTHPKRHKNQTGRLAVFLIDENTINVDKTFLDVKENGYLQGFEKWQWRKII